MEEVNNFKEFIINCIIAKAEKEVLFFESRKVSPELLSKIVLEVNSEVYTFFSDLLDGRIKMDLSECSSRFNFKNFLIRFYSDRFYNILGNFYEEYNFYKAMNIKIINDDGDNKKFYEVDTNFIENVLKEISLNFCQVMHFELEDNMNLYNRQDEVNSIIKSVLTSLYRDGFISNLKENCFLDEDFSLWFKNYLSAYYSALYFNNVHLLQKFAKADLMNKLDVYVIAHRTIYDSFLLRGLRYALFDDGLTSYFEPDEYIKILIRWGFEGFQHFYFSIRGVKGIERNKYLNKFSNIIKKSHLFNAPKAFSKSKLDMYEEETYLKATPSQLNNIIGNSLIYGDESYMNRFNELIREGLDDLPDFFQIEMMLDKYSNKELLEMSKEKLYFINNIIFFKEKYFNRALNICEKVGFPARFQASVYKYEIFYEMFSDDVILSFNDEELECIRKNIFDYFKVLYKKGIDVTRLLNLYKVNNNVFKSEVILEPNFFKIFTDREIINYKLWNLTKKDLSIFTFNYDKEINERKKEKILKRFNKI